MTWLTIGDAPPPVAPPRAGWRLRLEGDVTRAAVTGIRRAAEAHPRHAAQGWLAIVDPSDRDQVAQIASPAHDRAAAHRRDEMPR